MDEKTRSIQSVAQLASMLRQGQQDPMQAMGESAQAIGPEEAAEALDILQEYKEGKSALEERIVMEEEWYRMRHWEHMMDDLPDDVSQPRSAWLRNTIMAHHADAMDNYPQPNVLPREQSDKETAEALSKVLPVVLERAGFQATYDYNWWEKLKFGTGVYMVTWDKEAENGLGDISIKPVDILNVFWQPGVRDLQMSRNVFVLGLVDNDILDEMFPEREGEVRSEGIDITQYIHDDTINTEEKSVVVDWYYRKKDAATGRTVLHYAKLVGTTVLYASENDPAMAGGWYEHGRYPILMDTLRPEKDTPTGTGYIYEQQNTQEYIDKLSGYMLDHVAEQAHQKWYISRSAGINRDQFRDPNERIVEVEGSIDEDRARAIDVPTMTGAPMQMLEWKVSEMKETAANRDFSNGSGGQGITAASAIYALQESGNKISRDELQSAYRVYREICYLCIELMRQFYTEDRFFRVTMPNGQEAFMAMNAQQLQGQPGAMDVMTGEIAIRKPIYDITIEPQRRNPFNTAAQNELALQLYSAGFYEPARGMQALACLKSMEFVGKDEVESEIKKNYAEYLMQQMAMMQDQQAMMAAKAAQEEQEPAPSGKPVGKSELTTDQHKEPATVKTAKKRAGIVEG